LAPGGTAAQRFGCPRIAIGGPGALYTRGGTTRHRFRPVTRPKYRKSGRRLMRFHGLALACCLLTGTLVQAQQQPAQQQPAAPGAPNLDPASNRLDALLLHWQQKMLSVQALAADCTRTTVDFAWKSTEVFEGTAKFMSPDLAALHMVKKSKP